MRAKFILPGIALAAFAATVFFSEWSGHRSEQLAAPTTLTAPAATLTVPTPTAPPTETATVPAATPAVAAAEVPAPAPEATAAEAAQPPLPDPTALPSYTDDQAARDSVRSARTR